MRVEDPTGCAATSARVGEPATGTAAVSSCWVAVQQDGPWGARAITQSRLDPAIGAALDRAVSAVGGRFALLRPPGAHAHVDDMPRLVLMAGGPVHAPWLVRGHLTAPERLLDLPADALADPTPARMLATFPELSASPTPVLLVCTNGRRDRCCAIRSRPVAAAAHRARPGQVFETTHLGGHRFAPTAVLLPTGQTYARLDATTAVAALDEATSGTIPTGLADAEHNRGRSGLSRPAQAAEQAIRELTGCRSILAPRVGPPTAQGENHWRVPVTLPGIGAWAVDVTRTASPVRRPESCGKSPSQVDIWQTRADLRKQV